MSWKKRYKNEKLAFDPASILHGIEHGVRGVGTWLEGKWDQAQGQNLTVPKDTPGWNVERLKAIEQLNAQTDLLGAGAGAAAAGYAVYKPVKGLVKGIGRGIGKGIGKSIDYYANTPIRKIKKDSSISSFSFNSGMQQNKNLNNYDLNEISED